MGRPLGSKNKSTLMKLTTTTSLKENMSKLIETGEDIKPVEKNTGYQVKTTKWAEPEKTVWDGWDKWKRSPVTEKSQSFIDWCFDVQDIVNSKYPNETHNIDFKVEKKYIKVFVVDPEGRERVFAFIEMKTGDILTPYRSQNGEEYPIEDCFSGNIAAKDFRISCITPTGVRVNERWMGYMPTHPDYVKKHYGD